jgi:hypothetical protein
MRDTFNLSAASTPTMGSSRPAFDARRDGRNTSASHAQIAAARTDTSRRVTASVQRGQQQPRSHLMWASMWD